MAYHYNYEGALVGSIIGMMVAFLANEIRAKFDWAMPNCVIKSRLARAAKWLWFENIKKQYHCLMCKNTDFRVLDFHHRDPATKFNRISDMINNSSKSKILTEIQKCDCLCANCHRILHHEEKQNLPVGQRNIGHKKNLSSVQLDV